MPSSIKEMLAEANAAVPRVPPAEVRALTDRGNVLVVDVRDPSEVQASGKIKGAINVSRGTTLPLASMSAARSLSSVRDSDT